MRFIYDQGEIVRNEDGRIIVSFFIDFFSGLTNPYDEDLSGLMYEDKLGDDSMRILSFFLAFQADIIRTLSSLRDIDSKVERHNMNEGHAKWYEWEIKVHVFGISAHRSPLWYKPYSQGRVHDN